jgi:hypothetical protein
MNHEEWLCRRRIAWLRWLLTDATADDERPTVRKLLEEEEAKLNGLTAGCDES